MRSIKTELARANVRAGEGVLQCVAVCRNMLQCSTRNSMCITHTVTHTQHMRTRPRDTSALHVRVSPSHTHTRTVSPWRHTEVCMCDEYYAYFRSYQQSCVFYSATHCNTLQHTQSCMCASPNAPTSHPISRSRM